MAIEIIEQPTVELSKVAVSKTHGEDSPYFAGWKAYDENPYDEIENPTGVIQMGLAENQVSLTSLNLHLHLLRPFDHMELYNNLSSLVTFIIRFHLIC